MRRTARSSEDRRSANAASGKAERATPQRTCVACRKIRAKRELVRIVRSPGGELSVDLSGKVAGRGAYLDPDPACLDRGLRDGAIARALEVDIAQDVAERLRSQMDDAAKVRRGETT
jgi:predicted RNA-binding protein YlxR (DUF448 family)